MTITPPFLHLPSKPSSNTLFASPAASAAANTTTTSRFSIHLHRLLLLSDDKPTVSWLKRKVSHDLKDDIKDKCITVFSRIGNGSGKHKRHSCAEFRYDPLSYSLNFEDGFDGDDEAPWRNFSSRLPPSPPVKALPHVREITAVT